MEIIFLLVGLTMMAAAAALAGSEIQARRGTRAVNAEVIGFSTGRIKKESSVSFYPVARYVGPDGRAYYVEGAVGSSVPQNAVGDSVTVLVDPTQPQRAILKSGLSYVLAAILAFMGIVFGLVFPVTFNTGTYSLIVAVLVIGTIVFRARSAWRDQPLSLDAWREYKSQIFRPRVFTDESKDQISWADPISLNVAAQTYYKSARYSVPLLFVFGVFGLLLGYYFYQKTEAFLGRADAAAGVVVDLKETGQSDSTTYAAVVEFRDRQGQTRQFVDSFSSTPPAYTTGQRVNVLYNRDNPSEAQIDRGRANYWLAWLCGSVGGLFIVLGTLSTRRRRFRYGK